MIGKQVVYSKVILLPTIFTWNDTSVNPSQHLYPNMEKIDN